MPKAKEDALAALKEGYDQLEKAKSESLEQLDDAKRTLDDAKAQIDAMAKGSWTVLDRKSHYASATYHSTIDQMRAIGDIFPLFFILVAALLQREQHVSDENQRHMRVQCVVG